MLNILTFVFVLANFEITLSRYLLVRVNQDHNPGTETLTSEVQSRAPHTNCWDCVSFYCYLENEFGKLANKCQQYNDDKKFPSKKYIVNCAMVACVRARNEIDEVCVDGILLPGTPEPPPNNVGSCKDKN